MTAINVEPMVVTLTSIIPSAGAIGSIVTITGSGWGTPTVTFNGMPAQITSTPTSILTQVPALPAGTGLVTVTVFSGGQFAQLPFTVLGGGGPTITSIEPDSGSPMDEIMITGSGFVDGLTVAFNGVPATAVWVESATELTAEVPEGATSGPIGIVTDDGYTVTSPGDFTVTNDDSRTRKARARMRKPHGSSGNAIEAAITAAWLALFEPGPSSLPSTLAFNDPLMPIPQVVTEASMSLCNLCADPTDIYMVPGTDATVTLDSMWLMGLSTIASASNPTFSADDTSVVFTVTMGPLDIGGAWSVTQTCDNFNVPVSQPVETGTFSTQIPQTSYLLAARATVDPTTQVPVVSITGMSPVGPCPAEGFTFQYDNGMPTWLAYLTGQWLIDHQVGKLVSVAAVSGFTFSALPQIASILNTEIAKIVGGDSKG